MAAFTGTARNSLRGMMYEFNNYKKVHIDGNTAQPLYHIFFTITPAAWLYESYHQPWLPSSWAGLCPCPAGLARRLRAAAATW